MKALKYADTVVLIALSVAGILFTTLDYVGVLVNIPWFRELEYPKLVLLLLGAIGLHLGVAHIERSRFHRSLAGGSNHLISEFRTQVDKAVRCVRGVEVTLFPSAADQERYLAKRLADAKIEICDLSWKASISVHAGLPDRQQSHKAFQDEIGKTADRIAYREVFVFSDPSRIEKLKRRVSENSAGYSCAYFKEAGSVPRLQFVIIDREEIVFASSEYPSLCSIRQQELAALFQSYYDSIWKAATPLKVGTRIYQKEVDRVLANTTAGTTRPRRGA